MTDAGRDDVDAVDPDLVDDPVDDDLGDEDDDLDDELDDDMDDDLDDVDELDDDDPAEAGDDEDGDGGIDPNAAPGATATAVLEYLVKSIVDDGDAVDIDVEEGRRGLSLRVRVDPDDMGRVIGKRGRIANAIRTVVRAAAVRDGVEVDVDFVD